MIVYDHFRSGVSQLEVLAVLSEEHVNGFKPRLMKMLGYLVCAQVWLPGDKP